ncbi:MAG: lipopolysaccharide heptosyltransferase II [Candidatus Omnitrophica bacterium]|jgi:heptosyltransferase-2|nr:lipopolysaccharide heptosyltransferase II [Candidatus Omnitrophota bacterium]
MPINKILIFGPNWIGDTMMSTPLVRTLKESLPKAHITIAIKPYLSPLWKNNPYINEIWEVKMVQRYRLLTYWGLFKRIKKQKFDLVIVLPHCLRYVLISFLARIPNRIGYDISWLRKQFLNSSLAYTQDLKKEHMVKNYLGILKLIGIKPKEKELILDIDYDSQKAAENTLKDKGIKPDDLIIGIAPGATYGKAKRWPEYKFAELTNSIAKRYLAKIMVFIGPDENKLSHKIKNLLNKQSIILDNNSSLLEVASLIKRCRLLISNDSGLMHIASALGVKVIAIFGSSSPLWTAPYGNGHTVIKKELSCSPCFKKKCPYSNYKCLESVEIEEVLTQIDKHLKRRILCQ